VPPKPITIKSVEDGIVKLIQRTDELRAEVTQMRKAIGDLVQVPNYWDPPDSKTDEPRSQTTKVMRELLSNDFNSAMRIIRAWDDDLFAAFQDLRAARLNLEDIASIPELRQKFQKNWQKK
jgi:hypothetical protein